MKFYGNANFQDSTFAQQLAVQAETSFPTVPSIGRIVFKDKRLYICVEIVSGLPSWIPLTNEIDTYIHDQTTGNTTWTVTHNLNTTNPMVQVYDDTHKMMFPDNVEAISNSEVVLTFGTNVTGRAIIMHGDIAGAPKTEYAYTHSQISSSATWTINHNLGYYPIVRVFLGNEEVQPASIIHDTVFTTTVTFSSTQTGTARLI